ncbi:MAG: hypothetical protein Q4F66_11910 [Clostridium sp.]|nr:hypothetical protein [Clostridium sp.]
MSITNVISNTRTVFKDIIVRNRTDMNLKNLHLSYEGVDRPVLNISDLPKSQQIKKSLLINYLTEPTKLLLVYKLNDDAEKKVLAYDNICRDDLRTLTLTILNDNDGLKVDSSVDSEEYQ